MNKTMLGHCASLHILLFSSQISGAFAVVVALGSAVDVVALGSAVVVVALGSSVVVVAFGSVVVGWPPPMDEKK